MQKLITIKTSGDKKTNNISHTGVNNQIYRG